jgi:serine/threonine-protein kinase SRPK3
MGADSSSDPAPEWIYRYEEGVKVLERYEAGGYHPTHIGDRLRDGRYEVRHKLGHGSYSTVWLARDHLESRYVALKILMASASQKSHESDILRKLGARKVDHPGRPFVLSLLDNFCFQGPNGRHLCVVTEFAGCSVAQSKEAGLTWKFPLVAARSIAAQTLLGLSYIHSCNIVHGGKSSKERMPLLRLLRHISTPSNILMA